MSINNIESHPLRPFLLANAKYLMLGSFPPKKEKWSMEFFYPNWINDMWRIMGFIFFDDRHHFEINDKKQFDKDKIVDFCKMKGIALYDTASEVIRLKDNASDKFLEVVKQTDVKALLRKIPQCENIITTGQKATDIIVDIFQCEEPKVGEKSEIIFEGRRISFWRMPSSSRAYPMSLENKAEFYKRIFHPLTYFNKVC
ncbi:MAG: uracil-DNA glycosylase family protein [Lentimicrobiaceae bacterium]|nr:uracil-DNA glycosylase family protein [Lentimicrobiaceae bacterium]